MNLGEASARTASRLGGHGSEISGQRKKAPRMEKETDTATWKCFSFRLTKSGEFPHPPEPQRSSEHLTAAVGNKITKLSFLPAARFARQDFPTNLPSENRKRMKINLEIKKARRK